MVREPVLRRCSLNTRCDPAHQGRFPRTAVVYSLRVVKFAVYSIAITVGLGRLSTQEDMGVLVEETCECCNHPHLPHHHIIITSTPNDITQNKIETSRVQD